MTGTDGTAAHIDVESENGETLVFPDVKAVAYG